MTLASHTGLWRCLHAVDLGTRKPPPRKAKDAVETAISAGCHHIACAYTYQSQDQGDCCEAQKATAQVRSGSIPGGVCAAVPESVTPTSIVENVQIFDFKSREEEMAQQKLGPRVMPCMSLLTRNRLAESSLALERGSL
ncbi:hypothetical protein GW7_21378 [Heterocephalus glaber]|uniref:Uncharacterized protein n=1 Tax=Heterocephalus glaber TaxID=10181 RepID=G5CAY3_HETGA|nr:hypothetical protein GW7_21378 [Heterocephalus glaber]